MSDENSRLPKPRKVDQVVQIINEIYNKVWQRTLNLRKLHKCGDELDAEKLLNVSPLSWNEIKEGNMKSRELFGMLKNHSEKTFATRDIFMKWLKSRDKSGLLFNISRRSLIYTRNRIHMSIMFIYNWLKNIYSLHGII